MFWLKKVVSFWLMPLPLCVALLVLGLVLVVLARRRAAGLSMIAFSTLILLLLSSNIVSTWLTHPLEARFEPIPELNPGQPLPASIEGCAYIAVLGSGHSDIPGVSATGALSTAGLGRIVEGVRLMRALPNSKLIVSGPGRPYGRTHASVLASAAMSLGADEKRLILLETAKDTEEEAIAVAAITSGAKTALVTSAWHMPRAVALFKAAGVNFVACPADFAARSDGRIRWSDVRIDSESLERSTLGVHEDLGLLWLSLRGVH
ncbi:MAG TPA: ElyC/SanA/YdcF family protein [Opitutaceae bacterium]|jgi:uncharacterized SAM-binding protein YcdF (DUF218 family)|nr:ElyC/SanA/YdcF family protein [Opitutaceae bacterium]